jgi:hypothetical protein
LKSSKFGSSSLAAMMLNLYRAEYPLQWLGECLINQSILYEGNPDTTNVKERFRYNFDAPPLVQEESTQEEVNGMEATAAAAPEPMPVSTAPSEPPASNEQAMPNGAQGAGNESEQRPQEESQQGSEVAATDTVMGGTS